jgi:hypothetical protein
MNARMNARTLSRFESQDMTARALAWANRWAPAWELDPFTQGADEADEGEMHGSLLAHERAWRETWQ